MADNTMDKEVCAEHQKACAERFSWDKDRLDAYEKTQLELIKLQTQMTEILKNQTKQLAEQHARLCDIEKNPKQWMDKVVGFILAAVVAAVVSYFMDRF